MSAALTRAVALGAVAHHHVLSADARDILGKGVEGTALVSVVLALLGSERLDGTPVEEVACRLREAHPHIGIFVLATEGEGMHRRLVRLAHAGVDELYFVDAPEEYQRLADHIRRRIDVPPPQAALRLISGSQTARHRAGKLAMWLVRNAYRNPSIDDAAAHFGMHRTTIWRSLRETGLPDPGTVLRCGRVRHVMRLLGERGLEPQDIADRLGMESEVAPEI